MKGKIISERGQALVLIAFAIIGLVAITGLAIDGGMAFSDRRHAQNAADTAAQAGALAKINAMLSPPDGPGMSEADARAPMRVAALDRAESNGYTHNLITSTVEVYTCDEIDLGATCEYPYAGNPEYVQVIITSHVDTFFARVIGIPQVHNRVQAVALAKSYVVGSLFDGAGVVSLNDNCPPNGSLIVNGSANVSILGGGMLTNSDGSCAFVCGLTCQEPAEGEEPKCSLYICNEIDELGNCVEEGTVTSVTGATPEDFTYNGQCQTVIDATENPEGEDAIPYPPPNPVLLPPATACDPANLGTATYVPAWEHPDTHVISEAHRITPGYYPSFPPKKDVDGNQLSSHIVMEPGTYCVDTVLKVTTDNIHVYGNGVTIWITAGYGFTLNGGVVELLGSSDEYPGYLIIVESSYPNTPVPACTMEGNGENRYRGAIYAPYCNITINGTSDTPDDGIDSQIIGYNVTINGNANLTINYNKDNNPVDAAPAQTGLAK